MALTTTKAEQDLISYEDFEIGEIEDGYAQMQLPDSYHTERWSDMLLDERDDMDLYVDSDEEDLPDEEDDFDQEEDDPLGETDDDDIIND